VDFEEHRGHLFAVAYRMLGSAAEAQDAVQETWLRRDRAARTGALAGVRDERAWLTAVTGRICLDLLTSARARREAYVGPWLPEPLLTPVGPDPAAVERGDPANRAVLRDSVRYALMVVLETLTPAERTAFVLHDAFGLPFEEVAQIVGRSPVAVRQLASRARRHVRDRTPRAEPDPGVRDEVVAAFFAAAGGGDLDRLVRVLDPDVVLRADAGGTTTAARRPVTGADKVARFLIGLGRKAAQPVRVYPVRANGEPAVVVRAGTGAPFVVMATVAGGRVVAVDLVLNPAKLTGLDAYRHLRP